MSETHKIKLRIIPCGIGGLGSKIRTEAVYTRAQAQSFLQILTWSWNTEADFKRTVTCVSRKHTGSSVIVTEKGDRELENHRSKPTSTVGSSSRRSPEGLWVSQHENQFQEGQQRPRTQQNLLECLGRSGKITLWNLEQGFPNFNVLRIIWELVKNTDSESGGLEQRSEVLHFLQAPRWNQHHWSMDFTLNSKDLGHRPKSWIFESRTLLSQHRRI